MSTLDKYKAIVKNIRPLFVPKTCRKCGRQFRLVIGWNVIYDGDKSFQLCPHCCPNQAAVRGFCNRIELTISHFE